MRKFFGLALLFFAANVCVAQLADDFSDGDFTLNTVWSGNRSNFIINGSLQLQLNNTVAGTSYLTTPISVSDMSQFNSEWQVYVKQTFSASGSNYGRVYLISDQANLSQSLNGYYLQFGEAGSTDAIELFKQSGTTRVSVCRATNGSIASSFGARVKVTRSSAGKWQLLVDYSGGNNFVLEATGTDVTHNTSSFIGVECIYTLTNANKFFYDDFLFVVTPIPDITPPALQSILVINNTTLDLLFSEFLDPTASNQVSNYSINQNVGTPSNAILKSDNKTVRLSFINSFKNGYEHQLSVSGVKDIAGNEITALTQIFLYFIPTTAKAKDIIINEFLPDPSPVIGLPDQEFVELYNRSNVPFNLAGWKLTDRSSTAVLPSQIILPEEYWIVTSSSAAPLFTSLGKTLGVSNFPTLNNANDKIILLDPTGLKVDSLSYNSKWYNDADKQQGGWTLELLNPDTLRYDSANWLVAIDATGGTPGKQNSQLGNKFDQISPELINLSVVAQNQLQLLFNEPLDLISSQTISNYFVTNQSVNPQTVLLAPDKRTITLTFQAIFINGVTDSLTITKISDVSGNLIKDIRKEFLYFLPQPVLPKDIIITEIMADPAPVVGLPEVEYIEIFNRSGNPINLLNWTLTDGGSTAKFPSKIILPNEYWIVHSSTSSQFNSYPNRIALTSFPSLNNSSDSVVLKSSASFTVDSIAYSLSWYRNSDKGDGGWSLELIDPENTCGEENNWTASEGVKGGTPGKQNSVVANKPDLTGPKLLSIAVLQPNQLLLKFDEKLEKQISDGSFELIPAATVDKAYFKNKALREIKLELLSELSSRQLYTITIKDLRDCNRNTIQEELSTLQFALPEAPDSLDVLVNEILFNPRPNGVDFLELYNNSPKYFNLKNWKLANIENGILKNEKLIASEDLMFAPFTYLAITEDPELIKNSYPNNSGGTFLKSTIPSFPDDEGSVVLADNTGKIIDLFLYTKAFHSPLIKDEEGVSLERISFQEATQDTNNWKSATSFSGYATPGYANSNARPETAIDESSVIVEPEVFSPESTFAKINFRFDQSSFSANVKIFDQQGRLIKTIANNETINQEGFFRWEGDREDGTKARFGYYLVWFEVFDPNGTLKTFRKRVVVAGD